MFSDLAREAIPRHFPSSGFSSHLCCEALPAQPERDQKLASKWVPLLSEQPKGAGRKQRKHDQIRKAGGDRDYTAGLRFQSSNTDAAGDVPNRLGHRRPAHLASEGKGQLPPRPNHGWSIYGVPFLRDPCYFAHSLFGTVVTDE